MPSPLPPRTLPAALAALWLLACSPGRPQLSRDLADAEALPVKKKHFILFSGERLAFGAYAVNSVKRDSSQKVERPRHSRISVNLRQTYAFRLSDGAAATWSGNCLSEARRQDEVPFFGPLREKEYRVELRCDLASPGGRGTGQAWKLDLLEEGSNGRALKGILTDGSESLRVTGSKLAGNEAGHAGFEFSDDAGVLGAVVLAGADRVLLRPVAAGPVKPALAAAAAALILYLDSNEEMKQIAEARLQADRNLLL